MAKGYSKRFYFRLLSMFVKPGWIQSEKWPAVASKATPISNSFKISEWNQKTKILWLFRMHYKSSIIWEQLWWKFCFSFKTKHIHISKNQFPFSNWYVLIEAFLTFIQYFRYLNDTTKALLIKVLPFFMNFTAFPTSSYEDTSSENLLFPLLMNSLSFSWFTMDTRPPPRVLPLPLAVEVLFLLAPSAPSHTTTSRQHSNQAPRGSKNMATGPRVQLCHMAS